MKNLSFKDYPYSWNIQDAIKTRVNIEAELMIADRKRELRLDNSKHPQQWSESVKRAFAFDIRKYLP